MEALKQQLLRIQQQIAALTPTQKMLTMTLVAILVMTMFYWSKYAGTAEKTILLDQAMSAEEISMITNELSVKNIGYVVQGDRIMVPTDKKFEIIANLGYMQLLPHNMTTGFEDIVVKYASPFDNNIRSEALLNQAKMRTLGGIIAAWPGVKSAAVNIDATRKYSPGHDIMPVGSISITMKSGLEPNRKLAVAAADLLIGSQSGLKRENVKVLINNNTIHFADDGSGENVSSENYVLERKSQFEKYYMDKILNTVHITDAYATVNVDLETKSSIINKKDVDSKNTVKIPKKQTSKTSENDQSGPAAGEPGSQPNTGVSIDGPSAGASGTRSNTETTDVENDTDHGVTNTVTQSPAGNAIVSTAAINVPEDFFVSIWKRRNPAAKAEPSVDDIEKLVKERTPQIRELVKRATGISNDDAITVASYVDVSQPFNPTEGASNATLASIPSSMGFGAKEIAIGVLALVSLFMVSMMVKKSTPPGQVIIGPNGTVISGPGGMGGAAGEQSPEVVHALAQITANADLAGEVGEGGMMLTGHELSEDEMESKQVIDQVGTMVQADPEAAANLVKRWISRE